MDSKLKAFWEKCGFRQVSKGEPGYRFYYEYGGRRVGRWVNPDQSYLINRNTPPNPTDPEFLYYAFKYAVPKLGYIEIKVSNMLKNTSVKVEERIGTYYAKNPDPALALYECLCKALGVEE